jgi:hypothetical protein
MRRAGAGEGQARRDATFSSRRGWGNVTCGNAVVRASSAQIVVRYDAFNTGCGDF